MPAEALTLMWATEFAWAAARRDMRTKACRIIVENESDFAQSKCPILETAVRRDTAESDRRLSSEELGIIELERHHTTEISLKRR